MKFERGLHRVEALDIDLVRAEAERAGWFTFALPGSGIVNKATFFAAARALLPLDPPVMADNWDALSDSLWGLFRHPARRIAILWPNSEPMARVDPVEFENAIEVLRDLPTTLADPRLTRGRPKDVAVIVG